MIIRLTVALTGVFSSLITCLVLLPSSASVFAEEGDVDKTVLVLDSSGSMKEKSTGGETKITAARKALRRVVKKLPQNQPVGMRVFGSDVYSADDPGACQDTKLVADVDTNNRSELLAAIDAYKPYGETPIGVALQEAGKDLGTKGNRNIILVSDGVPTCEPDPCIVARNLTKDGINLRIDVVGLDVNNTARNALRCIADKGNGTYYYVTNSDEFANSLIKITTRTARRYQSDGQPITGTNEPEGAPEITAGKWKDTTNGQGHRYYTLRRESPGSILGLSLTFRTPEVLTTGLELTTLDGDRCRASSAASVGVDRLDSIGPTTNGPDFKFWLSSDPCEDYETLLAKVSYDPGQGEFMELVLTEIPAPANWDDLPDANRPHDFPGLTNGPIRSVKPGTGFNDAAPVEPGRYKTNIVGGEVATFKVPVQWGQQVSARATFAKLNKRKAALYPQVTSTYVKIYGPGQMPVNGGPSYEDDIDTKSYMADEEVNISTASAPIRLTNVNSGLNGRDGARRP